MKKVFGLLAAAVLFFSACGASAQSAPGTAASAPAEEPARPVSTLETEYARQFTAETYTDGCTYITIHENERYVLVPEGTPVPQTLEQGVTVLQQPLDSIYLAATAAMDYFCAFDGLENIAYSGTDANGWYIPKARTALENGDIAYAGKYSAPNVEMLLGDGCDLAIQSTMILHKPEIKEQLESLGIPVLVDRSSYETHPLGRLEWIRLYGLLLDKEAEAKAIFDEQVRVMQSVMEHPATGKTVAFFYITANGGVSVRKSGDYIPSIIRMAGGEYIFPNLGDGENALSTTTIQMEEFYAGAREADYLVYNCSIDDELTTVDDLLAKSELMKDFKAVENGNVFATGKNLFQETMGMGDFMTDMNAMLTDEAFEEGTYMHRLK